MDGTLLTAAANTGSFHTKDGSRPPPDPAPAAGMAIMARSDVARPIAIVTWLVTINHDG